ncbi:phosphatase PAP2 family protein [Archaeoglobus veneficus]|uniref:phosphatase PAP2 family protein n=1 Tax=Archaeoglobus veneficus TaxID=58290 RepID=UPI000694A3BA|nr:phosphatase PAP2 family protein [Archaeoglobus veneficus]
MFNPKYFLLLSAVLIVFYDWKNSSHDSRHLFGRLAVISACYAIGIETMDFLLQQVYAHSSSFPQYLEDFSAIAGMMLGLTLSVALWRKLGYGREVICGALGLIAVSVPYTAISYIWNISGHVTFTAAPVTYLTALDRRLAILYVIPAIMVLNRPVVGAHTVLQSVAGLILGISMMLVGVRCYRAGSCTTC